MINLLNQTHSGSLKPSSSYEVITPNNGYIEKVVFPVEMKPLHFIDDMGDQIETAHKALVDTRNEDILYVGTGYSPIKNETILEALIPILDSGFKFQDIRVTNRRRFEFNLVHREKTFTIHNEEAYLRLKITNSYDGSSALQAIFGAYIQICSNGATAGKASILKMVHKGSASTDISHALASFTEGQTRVMELFQRKEWTVQEPEQLSRMLDTLTKDIPDLANRLPHPTKALINSKFIEEHEVYPQNPEFALFMAATDIATHGHKIGVPYTYQQSVDAKIATVFNLN